VHILNNLVILGIESSTLSKQGSPPLSSVKTRAPAPLPLLSRFNFIHIIINLVLQKALILNLLKTKRRLLHLKTQSVPRCKHFSSRL